MFLDGLWLKRSWGAEVQNVSLLLAIGVNGRIFRGVLVLAEGSIENEGSWTAFLGYLKERAVKVIRLFLSDKYLGLIEAARFRVLRFHERRNTPATIEFLQHVYEHFSFAI